MNKKINVIEHVDPTRHKSALIPIVGIFLFGAILFWILDHIFGGCDVLSYCPL